MKKISVIRRFGILLLFGVFLNGLMSCKNDSKRIVLKADDEYIISFEGTSVRYKIMHSGDDIFIGMSVDEEVVFGSHYRDDPMLYFPKENEIEITTITDSNADGLPDYRTIKNLKTSKVIKQKIDRIVWEN